MLLQVPVIPADSDDSASDLVYGSFGSDTIFLFIGAFIIAQAMRTHGLDRRFAFRVLSLPGVAKSTYRLIIAFGAIAASISAFISNTATAAMLLPIGLGMMGALGDLVSDQSDENTDASRLRFGTALMLMICYGAGVGGLLTPIGTPPNLIGIAFIESETGTTISFFTWVMMALPICLLMFAALCVILILLNKPEVRRISGAEEYVHAQRAELGPLSRGERNTLVVFGGRGQPVGAARLRRPVRGRRVGRVRLDHRAARRGHGRDHRGGAAVPAPDRLGAPPVHHELERGGQDRLGHRDPVRVRHRARHAALGHRARRDPRHRHRRQPSASPACSRSPRWRR